MLMYLIFHLRFYVVLLMLSNYLKLVKIDQNMLEL